MKIIYLKRKIIILILIIVSLAVYLYLQNNWVGLTKLEIVSEVLPENFNEFKIMQLSDLHSKSFGKDQNRLESIMAGAKPDIIVMTGDMTDARHYDENVVITLVKKAIKIAPVFYVTGNHEMWSDKFTGLEDKLKESGAVVLRNVSRKITVDGKSIYITGIDDPDSSVDSYNGYGHIEKKLHDTIPRLLPENFKVLLSHRPEMFNLYSSYGVDVVFSGHAHGGQFRLPFIGGVYSPGEGFFPKYTSGVYRDGNTAMVVSRGLGNSIMPLRLFNRPEVVLVTLRTADEKNNAEAAEGDQAGGSEKQGNVDQTSQDNKQTSKDNKQTSKDNEQTSKDNEQTSEGKKQALINETGTTVQERIIVPEGFERVQVKSSTFEEYLRSLPLKPHGSAVMYYNGGTKPGDVHEAVLDIDVGERDLQQCADSVIRLRAEYLYGKGLYDKIHFNFTNGFNADYSTWMKGNRIKVSGNKAYWERHTEASNEYGSFRKYLDMVFAYAGTLSLSKEMKSISVEEMQPGDVFMYGQTPGHCIIVMDMAQNKATGEKRFILAQGYMPAQDMHILKNPANDIGNPWYTSNFGEKLRTPEWEFSREQLMRFMD